MHKKKSLKERLLSKIQYTDTGCWEWTGCTVHGHGQIESGEGRKRIYAHCASYILFKGPIPEGLQIDHLCRNRACVNPDHLEPVTSKENTRRGESPTVKIRRSGYCARGHEINDANTYFHPRTGHIVHCRVCRRADEQEQRRARNERRRSEVNV